MDTPGKRLVKARKDAGFRSARAAAFALDVPVSTYNAHERAGEPGARLFSLDEARKYARRFGVDYLWLFAGEKGLSRQLAPDVAKAVELLSQLEGDDREFALAQLGLLAARVQGKQELPPSQDDRAAPKSRKSA